MNDTERRLLEENLKAVEIRAKYLYKKYAFPKEEFEEFFQVACMFICDRIHKYNGTTKFSTFVDNVLENAFIDRVRKINRQRIDEISIDECCTDCADNNDTSLAEFLKSDNDTENEALLEYTKDYMKKCINRAKLNCTSKTTVRGFDALELKMEGYTGAEIADMLSVPSNSLRSWISRAKKLLFTDKEFKDLFEVI